MFPCPELLGKACALMQTDGFPISGTRLCLIRLALTLHSCVCLFYHEIDYHCCLQSRSEIERWGMVRIEEQMCNDTGEVAVCVHFTVFDGVCSTCYSSCTHK